MLSAGLGRNNDAEARHDRPVAESSAATNAGDIDGQAGARRARHSSDELVGWIGAATHLDSLTGVHNRRQCHVGHRERLAARSQRHAGAGLGNLTPHHTGVEAALQRVTEVRWRGGGCWDVTRYRLHVDGKHGGLAVHRQGQIHITSRGWCGICNDIATDTRCTSAGRHRVARKAVVVGDLIRLGLGDVGRGIALQRRAGTALNLDVPGAKNALAIDCLDVCAGHQIDLILRVRIACSRVGRDGCRCRTGVFLAVQRGLLGSADGLVRIAGVTDVAQPNVCFS